MIALARSRIPAAAETGRLVGGEKLTVDVLVGTDDDESSDVCLSSCYSGSSLMPDAAIHHVSSGSRRKIGTGTSTFDNDEYEIISLVTVRLLTCARLLSYHS